MLFTFTTCKIFPKLQCAHHWHILSRYKNSTTHGGTNSNALLLVEREDNSEAGTVEKAVLAGLVKETVENVRPDEESASRWLCSRSVSRLWFSSWVLGRQKSTLDSSHIYYIYIYHYQDNAIYIQTVNASQRFFDFCFSVKVYYTITR